jgi:alkylhydroperoxidase family enzyme
MARIPYADPAKIHPKAREVLEKLPRGNIFAMLAHAETALDPFNRFGGALLRRGTLDPVLREIAIIRVGILSKAPYEVEQHKAIGREVGMTEAEIAGLEDGAASPAFDAKAKAVLRFTDDVVANVRASDATWNACAAFLDHRQLAELTLCIGFYMMVSRFLETFDVDMEGGQILANFKR